MKRPVVVALGLCVFASLAVAADLKPFQEEAKIKFDKQAKDLVADVNAACGTKFATIGSDFENFDPKSFTRQQPGSVCSSFTYSLKELCKSEPYKKAFAAKVKDIACLNAPGALVEMKGATLANHMSQDKSAAGGEALKTIKAFLDK
jgi:hypothetical protein